MKMNQNQIEVQAKVERKFAQYRKKYPNKKSGYPKALKQLVNSAFDQGLSGLAISQAAKVTRTTVFTWKKSKKNLLPPKELRVIPEIPNNSTSPFPKYKEENNFTNEKKIFAKITLCSGVQIEIPANEQVSVFLKNLCELGVLK